jgi:hypothetical protein
MALTKARNIMIDSAPICVTDFGAVGDGVTDSGAAIQLAVNAAAALGKSVYVPNGTFLMEVPVGLTASIYGTGTLKAKSTIGISMRAGLLQVSAENLTIEGLSFDCNAQCAAISIEEGHLVIDNIVAENSARAMIDCYEIKKENIVIQNSYFNNAGLGDNHYGDCIYLSGVYNPKIINNTCVGFTRIGIVCEGSSSDFTKNSFNPIITGNTCRDNNAATSTSTQPAGIWLENCSGGIVSNNRIENVTAVVSHYGIGISISGENDTNAESVLVTGNSIASCGCAYTASASSVISNSNIFDTPLGFYLGSNNSTREIIINNIHFANCTFDYANKAFPSPNRLSDGFIVGFNNIERLVVDGITETNCTRGTDAQLTDIYLFEYGGNYIKEVSLSNIQSPMIYACETNDQTNLRATNVHFNLKYGSQLRAKDYLEFNQCTFTNDSPTSSIHSAERWTFNNCTNLPDGNYNASANNLTEVFVNNCITNDAFRMNFEKDSYVYVNGSTFYGTTSHCFRGASGYTMEASLNGNNFLDPVGSAALVECQDASDSVILNGNSKNVATNLVTNSVSATVVQNNTTQF